MNIKNVTEALCENLGFKVLKNDRVAIFKKISMGYEMIIEVSLPAHNVADCKFIIKYKDMVKYEISIAFNEFDMLDSLIELSNNNVGGYIPWKKEMTMLS